MRLIADLGTRPRVLGRLAAGLSGLALAGTAAVALPATAGAEVLPENCAEIAADPARTHVECAFGHTGGAQTFTVPAGVTELEVTAVGGRGGASENAKGGAGAVVAGTLTVAPGTALTVNVGGDGTPSTAGFNGGGDGGAHSRTFPCDERDPIWDPFCRDVDETGPDDAPDVRGAGGGGATDVRDGSGLDSRIIVAGGGGGAGHWRIGGDAGAGGDYGARGKGGTSTSGGAGGGDRVVGTAGTLGDGGAGGLMGYGCQVWPGGGGGGLFGGGGGGQAADDPSYCGGGGGGSSLAPAGGTETVAADGQAASVLIRFTLDEPLAPAPCEGSLCVFTGSLAGLIGER